MTQEEKQLLLIDLCARLPYGVKVNLHNEICTLLGYFDNYVMLTANVPTGQQTNIVNIKPYLRPMSSMTKEEHKEYEQWLPDGYCIDTFDWLNAHHFDYRGLIPIGLAIEAPKDMYKTE